MDLLDVEPKQRKVVHYKNINMVSEFKVLFSFSFLICFKFLAYGFHMLVKKIFSLFKVALSFPQGF